MLTKITLLGLLALVAPVTSAIAGPIASEVVTLKGQVVSVVWVDRFSFESDGAEGLMTSGSKAPSHFVILQTESGTEEVRGRLSGYLLSGLLKWPHRSVAKAKLQKNQVIIQIRGTRLKQLKKGAMMELKSYQVKGDEWSTSSTFDELLIDGKDVDFKAEQAVGLDAE